MFKNKKWENMTNNNVRTLDERFSLETKIDVFKKERGVHLKPEVGMWVTRSIGIDSYPYTIILIKEHKEKKVLVLQADKNLYDKNIFAEVKYAEEYINDRGNCDYRDIKWNDNTKTKNAKQEMKRVHYWGREI